MEGSSTANESVPIQVQKCPTPQSTSVADQQPSPIHSKTTKHDSKSKDSSVQRVRVNRQTAQKGTRDAAVSKRLAKLRNGSNAVQAMEASVWDRSKCHPRKRDTGVEASIRNQTVPCASEAQAKSERARQGSTQERLSPPETPLPFSTLNESN